MVTSAARRGNDKWTVAFAMACLGATACSSSTSPGATSTVDASSPVSANDASQVAPDSSAANGEAAASQDGTAPGPTDASVDQKGPTTSDGATPVLKIMALGDSITRDTCWRSVLWGELHQAFPSQFHFVGTLSSNPGCTISNYETANQGYASSLVTEVVAGVTTARTCDPFCPALSDLVTAFNAETPDVILMHYGTNDVWNSIPPTSILNAYSAVIDAVRAANPNVIILVAQIIPMNVTAATCTGCSCATCPTAVPALNAQIATWAPTKSTATSPIIVVDQYTGFDAVADTVDGVHPNSTTGSQKMADKWYAALAPLF